MPSMSFTSTAMVVEPGAEGSLSIFSLRFLTKTGSASRNNLEHFGGLQSCDTGNSKTPMEVY